MKGLNKEERQKLAETIEHGVKFTNRGLAAMAMSLYPEKDEKNILANLGTDMIKDGYISRLKLGLYVKSAQSVLYKRASKNAATVTHSMQTVLTPTPSLQEFTDKELVNELRSRGWQVDAIKQVKL